MGAGGRAGVLEYIAVADGELLEWAEYGGHLYGTPRSAVLAELDAGNDVLLDIENDGAGQVKRALPEAVPRTFEVMANSVIGMLRDANRALADLRGGLLSGEDLANLGPVALSFVGASDKDSLRRVSCAKSWTKTVIGPHATG